VTKQHSGVRESARGAEPGSWAAVLRLALTLMAVATVATGPLSAWAGCPAFDLERSVLGFSGLDTQKRLTAADREAILKGGVIPGVPVGVWPPRGPAPLRVGVIWLDEPRDAQSIEFDADGDGTPEIVDTRIENFGYTYPRPGDYPAALRVRERDGSVHTYQSPVTVLSPRAFEIELQQRWDTFRAALQRRDVSAALQCVHSNLQNRLEPEIRAWLADKGPREMPSIRFVEVRVIEAICVGSDTRVSGQAAVDVRFVVDHDGVWRLAAFGNVGGRQ
jgi:hypothetical protein